MLNLLFLTDTSVIARQTINVKKKEDKANYFQMTGKQHFLL